VSLDDVELALQHLDGLDQAENFDVLLILQGSVFVLPLVNYMCLIPIRVQGSV
jgi:hypothetical protein